MIHPYPWHARQWAELLRVAESGRLGHALLFSGREGVGAEALAGAFAHWMLCEASSVNERPCGTCRGCHLFAAGTHPDFKTVTPVEEGKAIVIDQVREVRDYYTLKPHYERGKIVVINPADAMNRASANALLKVLEEPPAGALLLLVVQRFSAIAMTIRSRCVRIPCEHVDGEAAMNWLAAELPQYDPSTLGGLLGQAGGAPLTARSLANGERTDVENELLEAFRAIGQGRTHALSQAKNFADLPLQELLRILISMTSRLILAKFGFASFYERVAEHPDPSLQGLADHLNLKHLYSFLDLLFELKALLARHSGFRDADIAESVWLGLADVARSSAVKGK